MGGVSFVGDGEYALGYIILSDEGGFELFIYGKFDLKKNGLISWRFR